MRRNYAAFILKARSRMRTNISVQLESLRPKKGKNSKKLIKMRVGENQKVEESSHVRRSMILQR